MRSVSGAFLLLALCCAHSAAAQQWQNASTAAAAAKYALGSMMRPNLPGRDYWLAQGFRGVEYPRNYEALARKLATPGGPTSSTTCPRRTAQAVLLMGGRAHAYGTSTVSTQNKKQQRIAQEAAQAAAQEAARSSTSSSTKSSKTYHCNHHQHQHCANNSVTSAVAAGSTIKVVAFGGSITQGLSVAFKRTWAHEVAGWLQDAFPSVKIKFINLARDATDVTPAAICWCAQQ